MGDKKSSDRSQILRDVSNESLYVHKFLKIHGVMMDILALMEKILPKYKK